MSERVTLTRQEALALRRLRAEVDRASRRSAEVPTTEKPEAPDVTNFIQFRRKLIQFLNLPPDVSESALRKVLERSSSHLYKNGSSGLSVGKNGFSVKRRDLFS